MQKTRTRLTFVGDKAGKAEEAMQFYTSLFKNSSMRVLERWGAASAPDKEGTIKNATFTLDGLEYMAMDSAHEHAFTFTPAMSIFVECESEDELETFYKALSEGGVALMPLDNYGFSKKFGWVNDRYGVSWQLNLP
jgi:predicted 3-demethylubiquinone-9 3-methyltransferase (glyoxalase superfamily)